MFTARGITNKKDFLRRCGFTPTVIYRFLNDKYGRLSLRQIEMLCLNFGCTPNDILEWTPDKPELIEKDVPLKRLISTGSPTNFLSLASDLSYDKLNVLVQKIQEIKKTL